MQFKVVTIDVKLTSNTKRTLLWVLTPVAVLVGSIAVTHAWTGGTSWIASGQRVPAVKLKALSPVRICLQTA